MRHSTFIILTSAASVIFSMIAASYENSRVAWILAIAMVFQGWSAVVGQLTIRNLSDEL